MFHKAEGKPRKSAATAPVSAKVNMLYAAVALVCMLCGSAVLMAGAVGVIAAIPLCVFASVACAMLFTFGSGIWRAVPAVGAAISVVFGVNGVLFCATAILCGICVALCIALKFRRFETVLWLTLCVCAVLIAGLCLDVKAAEGSVSRESLNDYVSSITDGISTAYTDSIESLEYVFDTMGAMTEQRQKQLDELSSPDAVAALAKSIIISVPAYLAAGVSVLCYGMFSIFLLAARKAGRKLFAFRILAVPYFLSHVYLIFSFATFFVSAETVVGLCMFYITVLLTPCFVYLGIRGFGAFFRSGVPMGIRIAAVVMVLMFIPLIGYLIRLLAFFGAYMVMRAVYEQRINNSKNQ